MKVLLTRGSAVLLLVMFLSCSSNQSLQEYYVDNAENPNFISVDLPVSLLNLEKANLTMEQKEAMESLRKLNILAYKKTGENEADFQKERLNIRAILKNEKFTELMKMNTSYGKATVNYLGDENAIDEVIIYGDSDDKGFMVVRVLGKDMNPVKLVQFIQALEKSDYKGEGLQQMGAFFKGD
ncbi:DUF4252 domain-containing protein [Arenibacter certesii]|uniref:DUF4252 domain-containing protein n=1 Tax=Arenibacter certesii TaxID=228955 RepID=A0A918MMD9_9FLAO|nr:DUF4252 domain-containing protein [Arenibacter certesii]GGW40593.1 hypothetical protein GCM10007383_26700 [Arenibacter certesii]